MKKLLGNISTAALILLSIHSAAYAFYLPDTGQTKCYRAVNPFDEITCSGTGQDGEYNINPMSYTDNGNGTVTDNNTGLIWQKCSAGQNNDSSCSGSAATYNWYLATGTTDSNFNPSGTNICGALNTSTFGGHNDWRLPTEQELQTIVDYSIPSPGPTIKAAYFPNTIASPSSAYWSSNTYTHSGSYAWRVFFNDSHVGYNYKTALHDVRCVSGGQTTQSLSDNHNGTVTDSRTGLVWQKCSAGQDPSTCDGSALTYTWPDALDLL